MLDLEAQLIKSKGLRNKIIVTDGVFSMDGDIAKMNEICDLADKYEAMVMTDSVIQFIGKTEVQNIIMLLIV